MTVSAELSRGELIASFRKLKLKPGDLFVPHRAFSCSSRTQRVVKFIDLPLRSGTVVAYRFDKRQNWTYSLTDLDPIRATKADCEAQRAWLHERWQAARAYQRAQSKLLTIVDSLRGGHDLRSAVIRTIGSATRISFDGHDIVAETESGLEFKLTPMLGWSQELVVKYGHPERVCEEVGDGLIVVA